MTPSTPIDTGDGTASSDGNSSPDKRRLDKTKRSRWATRRMTVKSSAIKRLSLTGRLNRKSVTSEKKRQSGGSETLQSSQATQENGDLHANDDEEEEEVDLEHGPRQLYFNLPLPPELLDEDGNPLHEFTRNKIRTAKYTPLSFIPKNLWFQFQNVANIFFLFLVILVVSCLLLFLSSGLRRQPFSVTWPLTSNSSSLYLVAPIRASMPYL